MTTAIIIEDEKPAARRLLKLLQNYDINIIALIHNLEDAIHWFDNNTQPDLIFLDIQLSDGISFTLFKHHTIYSAIIFTTAYDEYALKAFKLNSIDYLLKPIDKIELKEAIDQYKHQNNSKKFDFKDFEALFDKKLQEISFKKRFTIKVGEHLKVFDVDEIDTFISLFKTTYIQHQNGRTFPIDKSLEEIEGLVNPKLFFRVNRSCILHINSIRDIISYSNSRLRILIKHETEAPIIVSRERVKEFKKWLDS